MRKNLLDEDRVYDSKPSTTTVDSNATPKKSTASIAAEVADKLTASSSSQFIMSAVLSTFAAQEAKGVGLMKPSTPSTSSMSNSENRLPGSDASSFMPQQNNISQNNPYHQTTMPQPSMQGQIPNSQAIYHSVPNPPLQYMQQYDYASMPTFPHGPPPYMVSQMVPMGQQPAQMTQQQQYTVHQQQTLAPPGFRPHAPSQPPGMVYYPYQSQ